MQNKIQEFFRYCNVQKRGCVLFLHLSPHGIAGDSQGWKQKDLFGLLRQGS